MNSVSNRLELRNFCIDMHGQEFLRIGSLVVEGGEVVVVMGGSGRGKSTLLKGISGVLERGVFSVSGDIDIGGESVGYKDAYKRRIGMIYQEDLLFPHMTVGENLSFGIDSDISREGCRLEVMRALRLSGLGVEYKDKDPLSLSGGERARVSLMRTLLARPRVLLLDEPFIGLDSKLLASMKSFVLGEVRNRGLSAIMVTHNQSDIDNFSSRTVEIDNYRQ